MLPHHRLTMVVFIVIVIVIVVVVVIIIIMIMRIILYNRDSYPLEWDSHVSNSPLIEARSENGGLPFGND